MGTIFLVRHGETEWSEAGRVQGWAPVPLSSAGVEQSRGVADALSDRWSGGRIVASDLRRTAEFASALSGHLDDPQVGTDRRFRERNFGVYQGLDDERYRQIRGEQAEGHPLFFAPENGESWHAVERRVLQAWDELTASTAADETVVLVSHYGPLHCILAELTGNRLLDELERGYATAGLSEVRIEDGGTQLVQRSE